MRRLSLLPAVLLAAFLASSCSDATDSLLPQLPEDSDPSTPGSSADIVDANSDAPEANPYFYWLNPFLKDRLKKKDLGVFDPTLNPVVTVCPLVDSWDDATESCNDGEALAEYSSDPDPYGDAVTLDASGEKYFVVFKTGNYTMPQGITHRVAVSIYGRALGWADMAIYDPENPDHAPGPGSFTADDVLLLNGNENQNIAFRIEDGALEQEFCPPSVEDCDVAIVDPNVETTLRVYENPGQSGEILGTLATVPPGVLGPDGTPYQDPFPVILQLQLDGDFQSGSIPENRQVPYFADVWTPVEGLYYDPNDPDAPGVEVILCQDLDGTGSIDEYLHDFLVVFLTRIEAGIATTELLPTTPGAEECAGFDHLHQAAAGQAQGGGIFSRFVSSLRTAARSLLPEPLYAKRRLHGGLNTTVRLSPSDGDRVSAMVSMAQATTEPETVLELGAVLNVDPDATSAAVAVPETGTLGETSTITVTVLDALEQPFLFEVGVTVEITGANPQTLTASYQGGGVYEATYTPASLGTDTFAVTLEEQPFLDPVTVGPYESEIWPVGPSAENTTFSVSDSEEGSPTVVTVTVLDENGQPYVDGETYPIQVAVTVESGETLIQTIEAVDNDGQGNYDGTYVASYTPEDYGDVQISVLIGGTPTNDSPRTITTAPRPADASQSEIQVGDGQVESITPVAVVVRNTAGEAYTYADIRPITISVAVTGANTATFPATDPEGDGTYEGSYTPANPGTDLIEAIISDITDETVDDIKVPQVTSEVAPLSGPLTVQVQISGPASTYVYNLPVELYDGTGTALGTVETDGTGTATFANVAYGFQYTVFLPKRDFDVEFSAHAQTVDFDQASSPLIFNGTSQDLPESVLVHRIGDDGNGNAYEYTVGGRSWTSASNQVRDYFLLGVDGHLATITSQGENDFVSNFYYVFDNLCPGVTNPKQCKFKGWIGLSDEMVEGVYEWVTDEPYEPQVFNGWPGGTEPIDRKGNEDYVEINAEGLWSITNGASTTNEGYFTEWEAWQPDPPVF